MKLPKPQAIGVVWLLSTYAVMALLLTCGCSLHVGEAPCEAYARAVEQRLTDCGYLPDDWYEQKLKGIYAQCDTGPFGITLVDADDAAACVEQVRAASCERMATGAPTCLGMVKL